MTGDKLKVELADNEEKILSLSEQHETDLDEFMTFAFDFLSNKGSRFFELTAEDMKRCKQLVFTGKIYVDENKNVYTNDVSAIFSGQTSKKDAEASSKSLLVR